MEYGPAIENQVLEEPVDWQWVLSILRRFWWLFLIGGALGAIGAFVVSRMQPYVYEAHTQVLVTRASSSGDELVQYASLKELTTTYADFLSQDWIREEVAQRIGGEIEKNAIKVSTTSNALTINIAVEDTDPNRAITIANTLVQTLIEHNEQLQASRYDEAEKRLSQQIAQIQSQIALLKQQMEQSPSADQEEVQAELNLFQQLYRDLLDKRETVRLQKLQNMPNVVQVSPARLSDEPVRPRPVRDAFLGGVIGLAVAVGGVFLKEVLDTSVRREEDLRWLGVPLLAVMEQVDDLQEGHGPYVMLSPRSPYAEVLRVLRTNLEFLGAGKRIESIVITSAGPEEGKTTLAVNLAAIVAQAGKRVIVVDADLRRPRIHKVFGVANRAGLTTLFRSNVSPLEIVRQWEGTSLYFITSGALPPNPADLLGSERMGKIIEVLQGEFDLVVFDTPPGFMADSQLLGRQTDGVILSGQIGKTNRFHLRQLIEQFYQIEVRVLGMAFFASRGHGSSKNFYYYQYQYYYQDNRGTIKSHKLPLRGQDKLS